MFVKLTLYWSPYEPKPLKLSDIILRATPSAPPLVYAEVRGFSGVVAVRFWVPLRLVDYSGYVYFAPSKAVAWLECNLFD